MTSGSGLTGRALSPGTASGRALVLEEPLSFWGGVDTGTGRIIDARHPQTGASMTGRIVVMPSGRGSSSSSSVLAESVRARTGPAAILLARADPIILLGAVVARELYGTELPVVVLDRDGYALISDGDTVSVDAGSTEAVVRIDRG
ncbi:MAG: aconitase X swivel domain-containing protein [Actinomycetota bacterium]